MEDQALFFQPAIKHNHSFGVILAGGGGKRLWPLSRLATPKQFIKLTDNKTLLESTIDRIKPLIQPKNLWIITTPQYKDQLTYLQESQYTILTEPESRNTAPAILFSILKIYQKDPEAVVFFVPSDHHIQDDNNFLSALQQGLEYAKNHDQIALIGLPPKFAATQYGYIEYGSCIENQVHHVMRFCEKPNAWLAQEYVNSSNMLWNTGIFCAKASVFIKEFEQYAPEIFKGVNEYFENKRSYSEIFDISFDKAVLEYSKNCVVIKATFNWSDVGNLEQFIAARQEFNSSNTKVIQHKSNYNLIDVNNKLVVLIDVNDLCVLETEDVLLISHRSQTDKVKEVLEDLKGKDYEQYL